MYNYPIAQGSIARRSGNLEAQEVRSTRYSILGASSPRTRISAPVSQTVTTLATVYLDVLEKPPDVLEKCDVLDRWLLRLFDVLGKPDVLGSMFSSPALTNFILVPSLQYISSRNSTSRIPRLKQDVLAVAGCSRRMCSKWWMCSLRPQTSFWPDVLEMVCARYGCRKPGVVSVWQ